MGEKPKTAEAKNIKPQTLISQIGTNSNALKTLRKLARGWSNATTPGKRPAKQIPSPIGWEKVAAGRMRANE